MLLFFFFTLGILILLENEIDIRRYTLGLAIFLLFVSMFVNINYMYYNFFYDGLFFNEKIMVINLLLFKMELVFLYDGFSLVLIFLTLILYLVSLLSIWNVDNNFKLLNILLLSVIYLVILSFVTFDLFFFYVFFEFILVPMFLIIGLWGSRDRKLTAGIRFLFYTVICSVFFFALLLYLYYTYGTTNLYKLLMISEFTLDQQKMFWFFMFLAFAVKVPLYPLHTWLPEAHAEAPTVGSILLAGILLKLGPYGLLRFSNVLFPYGFFFFRPLIYLLCFMGVYYTAITAIRQIDLKKIIAYSSIGHMAVILFGICSNTVEGLLGSIILLIAHGFVSGGLFLCVGFIYDRYKTRVIYYYGGLAKLNPKMAVIMFLFLLGNIAFPITLNFVAELFILISLMDLNSYLLVSVALSSVFVLSYNLFMFSRVFYGNEQSEFIFYNDDLTIREIMAAVIFLFPVFFWGLFSSSLTSFFYDFVTYYLFIIKFGF